MCVVGVRHCVLQCGGVSVTKSDAVSHVLG